MCLWVQGLSLGVIGKVGELLLFGFDVKIVVSDAVPLAVEEAGEGTDEEERKANSQNGKPNYI